jgi:predicted ATPase/DNA-binding NarL/FixJ family response regulator
MFDDRSRQGRDALLDDETGGLAASVNHNGSFLSTSEAAAALGLSQAAIRRAIASGDLAASRQGAAWHIFDDELVRFARQRNLPLPLVPRERTVSLLAPVAPVSALPTPSSELIGRDAEVARLVTLLEDPATWLVTLTGPGGVGKTRLALAAAEAMQDRLTDGAIFVDLSAVVRAADTVLAIAQALGLREIAGQDQRSQIASFLRTKNLLLVLDNVEQIRDAGPEIAQIARQAGATVLVTSRAPLRVGGEREMPVPPLPLASRDATPDELLASDAGRLFVERARARDPSFGVDEQSAPLIAQICARLDGLPLAIELAAARSKLLPPRQLHDRLERTLTLLTHGDRNAPPRHLTMRDAIAWSYDLLAPEEQRLFRQLAIFAGGFTLDAAEWVGARETPPSGGERHGGETPPSGGGGHGGEAEHDNVTASTLDRLDALLDQSMVVREVGIDGEPRFRMLETIRAYGLEQLEAAEEVTLRDLHAGYFCQLTQTLRPIVVTESARASLERLAADEPNLRAALTWLADRGLAADFGAMVAALSGYWFAYSNLYDADSWITQALTAREKISLPDQARLLIAAAILSGFRGEAAQAERAYAEGLPLSRAMGDAFDVAMALTTYGASRNLQGQYTAAAALLEEGRVVAASIADPRQRAAMMGRALANLGVTARGQGDLAAARDLATGARQCYEGLGFDLAETRALMDLAEIARDQDDLPQMVAHYQTCLAQTGDRGDMRVVCVALSGIASAATAWDQPRSAVLLYAAADAVRERVGLAVSLASDRTVTESSLATLRAGMSEAQFATIWAEGRALSLAQALAIAATVAPAADGPKSAQPVDPYLLTRRERDVLRLLAAGQTDRDIAEALFIGLRTVSWHVGSILGKLGVSTRREAAAKARADGLL